ncbi:hypothetical protein ONE63_011174 [Megalurothrips usitatus]|uniref:Reverse transcriptase domain-containing protein n=1 Tax=Megalurothrips usitatus TaxID=439358 RepID=A0AAV7X005_9NEOP|nr:hypothetical protein ONE63_011174 [Megalurothrips usitatus]
MDQDNNLVCSKIKLLSENYPRNLKLVHINAQSLHNSVHFTEFWDLFACNSIDVIGVSETFFRDHSQTNIPNYNLFNVNRNDTGAGGVAIYVHNRLKSRLLAKSSGESLRPEFVIVEVTIGHEKILVSCMYRPPKVGHLENYIDELSTLDIIASNCHDEVIDYGQCAAPGFSAHDLIYAVFDLSVPPVKTKIITYRDFKGINVESLIADAREVPWHHVYDCNNCDTKIELFNKYLLDLVDKHAPVKKLKVKNNQPPWMNDEIRSLIDKRDGARGKALSTNNSEDCKVWANIRKLGISKTKSERIVDFPASANALNQHYLNVSKIENQILAAEAEFLYNERSSNVNLDNLDNLFYFKFVPAHDIVKIVNSFKSDAVGVDGVSRKFILLFLDAVAFVLEHVINYCLQSGVFPSLWKCANVLPLPKVKNPIQCTDFRPISILCLFAKVLEKIVHDQMYDFAANNGIMNPLQSGYRKGHSTITALLKVTDDVRKSIDERKLTVLVLLDLSKAFDRVNHKLLLIKLRKLGFSSSVVNWLKEYLTNRWQRVMSGEFVSEWAPVETGVPQGSVLGPLLFMLYLHDISTALQHTNYHLYADDTQLYKDFLINDVNEVIEMVNSDLCRLNNNISSHNLSLNVTKTQPIIIGSEFYVQMLKKKEIPHIVILNTPIPYKEEVCNLGITLDSTLSWRQHVNGVVKKVFSTFAQIRRNFDCLPVSIRLKIVQSLILPQLDYGSMLFTNMNLYTTLKLQRAENACIRFITGASRFDHITPQYAKLELLKLHDTHTIHVANMLWKILKTGTPSYLCSMFKFSSRHPDRIIITKHRTATYANSFCICATHIFNTFRGQFFPALE